LTRRLTAIVRDEDLPDEARAAPGQHVILKLNLGGGHCDHEGMEQGRECQVGLYRGKSGSREQGSEVRGIGRAQGFGRSLSGDDDRRSGVDDRRLRVPVLLVYWRPRSRSRCARLNDTFLTRFSSTLASASTEYAVPPAPAFYRPHRLASPLGAEMDAEWMRGPDPCRHFEPSDTKFSHDTRVCETRIGRSTTNSKTKRRMITCTFPQ
jgi:hypothetical protein